MNRAIHDSMPLFRCNFVAERRSSPYWGQFVVNALMPYRIVRSQDLHRTKPTASSEFFQSFRYTKIYHTNLNISFIYHYINIANVLETRCLIIVTLAYLARI